MIPALTTVSSIGLVLLSLSVSSGAQTLFGPTPYLSRADSPFQDCVQLETFEDHLFNQPGVTADFGFVTSLGYTSSVIDSVDADDGAIDGSGSFGDSYFSSPSPSVTLTFSAAILGGLPTRAGVVWTDGSSAVTFEAFGPSGTSLGTIGPVTVLDGGISGTTAEDTFFGVANAAGISAIKLSCVGAFELDHLQYSLTSGPSATASETIRLGSPPNPSALKQSKATPPILGTLWAPYVDHATFAPTASFDFLAISFGPPINVPIAQGTLLCSPPPAGLIFPVPAGSAFHIPIPNTCSLVGAAGCSQAASLKADSTVQLTNALDFVLGTH